MDTVPLRIEERTLIGSGKLNKIRHSGYIPGIIYGKGIDTKPIQIKKTFLSDTMKHHGLNTIFSVDLGEKNSYSVVIQDIQYDHLKNEYLHIDLQRISMNEKREAHVPVRIAGKTKAEAGGGVLIHNLEYITVEGLPYDVPGYIDINVSDMHIGDTFTAEQLDLPENLILINNPHDVIVSLSLPRTVTEDLNPKDDTAANEIPIIGNDERETNAT